MEKAEEEYCAANQFVMMRKHRSLLLVLLLLLLNDDVERVHCSFSHCCSHNIAGVSIPPAFFTGIIAVHDDLLML